MVTTIGILLFDGGEEKLLTAGGVMSGIEMSLWLERDRLTWKHYRLPCET